MKKLIFFLVILFRPFIGQGQWIQQSYYAGPILNPKAINSQVAWATVFNHTGVIRTTNGGGAWNATNTAFLFTNFAMSVSLAAFTADTAWYLVQGSSNNKLVYKTTNGGNTWVQQSLANPNGYGFGIHFFDSKNGVLFSSVPGSNWDFYTTSNGGNLWMPVSMAGLNPAHLYGHSQPNAFAVKGNTIWFTGKSQNNMVLLKSTDRGHTWSSSVLPVTSTMTRHSPETIAFRDSNNGLFAVDSLLYRTSDGGSTWQPVNYAGPLCSSQIIHVPGTSATYMAVGSSIMSKSAANGSAVSSDDGDTWTLLDASYHMGVSFANAGIGWAGGANYVYKYSGNPLGTGNQHSLASTNNFTISPNPTTGIFTISADPVQTFTVEVYNLTGLKVKQQQIQPFRPGKIDLSNQPKGMYLLRILSKGQIFNKKVVVQ